MSVAEAEQIIFGVSRFYLCDPDNQISNFTALVICFNFAREISDTLLWIMCLSIVINFENLWN